MFYPDDVMEIIGQKLKRFGITVPTESGPIGIGYIQHAEAQCQEKYSHSYHIYMILEDVQLKDSSIVPLARASV